MHVYEAWQVHMQLVPSTSYVVLIYVYNNIYLRMQVKEITPLAPLVVVALWRCLHQV